MVGILYKTKDVRRHCAAYSGTQGTRQIQEATVVGGEASGRCWAQAKRGVGWNVGLVFTHGHLDKNWRKDWDNFWYGVNWLIYLDSLIQVGVTWLYLVVNVHSWPCIGFAESLFPIDWLGSHRVVHNPTSKTHIYLTPSCYSVATRNVWGRDCPPNSSSNFFFE